MSRLTEILNQQVDGGRSRKALAVPNELVELYPRFIKVKKTILEAMQSRASGLIQQMDTINWSGYDSGIHDYTGSLEGSLNEIKFKVLVGGTIIDNQPKVIVDEYGEMRVVHNKQSWVTIKGGFTSKDQREGAIEFFIDSDNPNNSYEAYWLQGIQGLHLEQVVANGRVFNAASLETSSDGMVSIPNTRIWFRRKFR